MSDNLTAVLHKINDLRLEQRPIPEPKDDEVLLKMACVGICGSDVHYYVHGRIADFIVNAPMVIGHEASGTVEKVGKYVTSLKPGDRVAIEPGVPCRRCDFCKEGNYNLCPDIVFCATPPVDGNLCRYYTHAADFCFKLPDHVSFEEGALLEPVCVGVHACRRGHVNAASNVLILGAGPVGLVTLLTAKAMGANKVLITDVVNHRLSLAEELGADFVLQVDSNKDEKELASKILNIMEVAPDVTIDCRGSQSTIRLALKITKNGGVVVLVGMAANEASIPVTEVSFREVDVRGVFRYANEYAIALNLVASGRMDVKKLITHKFKLEETIDAFETARTGKGNPIKVMIYCN